MDSRANYGSVTLFQAASFHEVNAKKNQLRAVLNARKGRLSFSYFMTGRFLSISVGLFCLAALFATAIPAVVSLLAMKLFQPETTTFDNITLPSLPSDSQGASVVHRRDINLLWAALVFSVAAVLSLFLYCIASPYNERTRYKKINMEQLLATLAEVPELKDEAARELIDSSMVSLAEIEDRLLSYLSPDVESESVALVRQGLRS